MTSMKESTSLLFANKFIFISLFVPTLIDPVEVTYTGMKPFVWLQNQNKAFKKDPFLNCCLEYQLIDVFFLHRSKAFFSFLL
jgi:hypothetical protein